MVDPCETALVNVPAQTDPADYTYDGTTTQFKAAYELSDASCSILYQCSETSGLNLCAAGNFDGLTGEWIFSTVDMAAFPPGIYPITVDGLIVGFPSQTN